MNQAILETTSHAVDPWARNTSPGARLMPLSAEATLFFAVAAPGAEIEEVDVQNSKFFQRDRDAVWLPLFLAQEEFHSAVGALRWFRNMAGLTVHDPYPRAISKLLDEISPRANMVGVVDSVRVDASGRWHGDITGVDAFARALRSEGVDPKGARVWLMGTGGMSAAAALSLATSGIASLTIAEVEVGASIELTNRLRHAFPGLAASVGVPDSRSIDIVVNGVAGGYRDEALLNFSPRQLRPGTLVIDLAKTRHLTPFAEQCADAGMPVLSGECVLEHQTNIYDEFFGFGRVHFKSPDLQIPAKSAA